MTSIPSRCICNGAVVILVAFLLTFSIAGHQRCLAISSQSSNNQRLTRQHRDVLLYVTTQLSETHIRLLKICWPALLAQSSLYRNADVTMLVTHDVQSHINMTFLNQVFHKSNFRIHFRPNPGHQEGAMLAMSEAFDQGWFDGYDWVIRVNPDVLIRNETALLLRMQDPNIDGIFVDCYDSYCPPGPGCNKARYVQTDFLAFRPGAMDKHAFKNASHHVSAELQATQVFSAIVNNRKDSWLSEAGPMKESCRVDGKNSPVLHTHDMDRLWPACVAWYEK